LTRPVRALVCCTATAILLGPLPARAQGVPETVTGAVLGTAAGTVVTAAAITVASLDEVYLWDTRDALGWPLIPVAAGFVSGAVQGSSDWDSVKRGSLHALLLGAAGAGVGAILGDALIAEDHGPWAGGVIGAGAGVLAGWLLGSLRGEDTVTLSGSVPLEIRW